MHDFAGDRVANAAHAAADHDLVTAEIQLLFLPLRLGDVTHRRSVAVARIQHIALGTVELEPGIRKDVLAHGAHQLHIEVHVVQPQELPSLRLTHAMQMEQIGNRVGGARRASARGVDRALQGPVSGPPQVAAPDAGKGNALLRQRRRQDAVEHVDATMHGLEQISRRADAHQIARTILRQQFGDDGGAVLALACPLAHGQAADRETIERHLRDRPCALRAQIRIACPLHDAEQGLRRIAARIQAALGPAVRQMHGLLGDTALNGRRHALIENHHDVAADGSLRGNAALGAQAHRRLIDITLELGAFLGDGAASGQREDLESAGIGQHRARPIHESMYAPELFEQLDSGPQHQMIGVREQYSSTALQYVFAPLSTHGPVRPHRHERGREHLVVQRAKTRRTGARARCGGLQTEIEPRVPRHRPCSTAPASARAMPLRTTPTQGLAPRL